MSLITPEDLKTFLELQGVASSELEDLTRLQSFIDLKKNEIISLTGLPVDPISRKQIIKRFRGDVFETDWYPICKVDSFKIDNVELTAEDYVLDESNGIFYFTDSKIRTGLLVIEYHQKLSDDVIGAKVNPLISDMVLYHITNPNRNMGEATSIHEMDTSVSYDTKNNLGSRIYARIDDLKKINCYSAKIKWL